MINFNQPEITSVYIQILKELDEKMGVEKRKYNLNSRETILYEAIREILKHLDRGARG